MADGEATLKKLEVKIKHLVFIEWVEPAINETRQGRRLPGSGLPLLKHQSCEWQNVALSPVSVYAL